MDPWGWIFLGAGLFVMGLSLWANRWTLAAAAILFLTCVASNVRHVYLDRFDAATVYALIDLCGGLAMIQVYRRSEPGKRRWLRGILALFGAMMSLHLLVWAAGLLGIFGGGLWLYRLCLSVLYAGQLMLAAIPGGRLALAHLRSTLRHGPRARAVQA